MGVIMQTKLGMVNLAYEIIIAIFVNKFNAT